MADRSPLKQTPLHATHIALGARMADFAGFDMPIQYTSIVEEHKAVRQAAGMFDVSHMGEVMVSGSGAEAYLQRLVTNDIAKMEVGRALYTVMCRPDGGIVDDLLVYRLAQSKFMLVVNAANTEKDVVWMREQLEEDVQLDDISDETSLIAVQGPRAIEIFERATGIDVSSVGSYRFIRPDNLVGSSEAIVSRTGYTGEAGLEIYCRPEAVVDLWELLLEAGKAFDIKPCGLGARDTLRLEAGLGLYGNELTDETNPIEAGLSWLVKFDSGDFIGREALRKVKEDGPSRRLVGFVLEERGVPRTGYELFNEDEEKIGEVTSGTQSPILSKGIGFGYVLNQPKYTEPGASIRMNSRGKLLSARVTRPPFHKK